MQFIGERPMLPQFNEKVNQSDLYHIGAKLKDEHCLQCQVFESTAIQHGRLLDLKNLIYDKSTYQ